MRISRRPGPLIAATFAVAALVGAAVPPVQAAPRIVNGLDTQGFPTTGALLHSGGGAISMNNAQTQCSGTLIGCRTFLTAAHCVYDDGVASHYWVYLQHFGIATVSSVTYHPSYDTNLSGRDVAIVKLSEPVTGITPTPVNSTHDLDALGVGLDGLIAGFGQTSGSGNDYGVKRYGDVVTANCTTSETNGESTDVLVCWDYQSPVGAPGTDSNTCNGDSGGPLFMDFAGTLEVVGVTSAGSSPNCLPTDHSWDASVYYNASWIAAELGADSTAACTLPPVGGLDVAVYEESGSLGSGNTSAYFEYTVSGSPSALRFSLNGTDNGTFDPDLFVKAGTGASPSDFDDQAVGGTVYGGVDVASPSAGTWSAYVRRSSGSGQFQLTTTVFGGDPPVCGNDVREYGEDCDGTDDSACEGLCTVGCTCPAPVCGNDVVESGEDCDGASDAACPGQCQGDCSCYQPCTTGPLYGLRFRADDRRFTYKGLLQDYSALYVDLDPRDGEFRFDVTDVGGTVQLSIPAADAGWVKADPVRRRYIWKGDGTLDGLKRVKLIYKDKREYWIVLVKGREVPGAGTLNLINVLDFELGFDSTCHLESW